MSVAAQQMGGAIWLDTCLAPLAPFLAEADLTDLHINQPGEVWLERLSGPVHTVAVPELSAPALERLARQIAATTAQGISREHPLLAATLPTGERVQVVLPPATRGHPAFSIRRHVSGGRELEDYVSDGAAAAKRSAIADVSRSAAADSDPTQFLRDAVKARRNILVSGGTSTGKTTFLNALIREISTDERLVAIEDTPELQIAQPNFVGLLAVRGRLGEAEVTAEDLLVASLRMRPDRIILGEVRGSEAMTFLRAINTGHPGSLSTIHADTPQGAIDQLVMLALQAGSRMRWEDLERYIRRTIGVIVQLERQQGRRVISQVIELS